MDEKNTIRDFIKNFDHCVMATVTPEGLPECAIIEFAETPELEIIFDTSNEYRKYKNIKHQPYVAFAIGSRDANTGLQYEGTAKEIQGSELIAAKEIFFSKCPDARKWENDPTSVYFKVIPSWIRYRSYATDPMTEFEINF